MVLLIKAFFVPGILKNHSDIVVKNYLGTLVTLSGFVGHENASSSFTVNGQK